MTKSSFVTATVKKILRFEIEKSFKPCWGGYWLAKKSSFLSLDPLWNGYPDFTFTVLFTIRFHRNRDQKRAKLKISKIVDQNSLKVQSESNLIFNSIIDSPNVIQGTFRKVHVLEISRKYSRSPKNENDFV